MYASITHKVTFADKVASHNIYRLQETVLDGMHECILAVLFRFSSCLLAQSIPVA